MRKSLRPYVTAGVALVGASVLAVTPVIATPRDVATANPAVALSASPIDPYLAIFARARTNAEALLEAATGDPATGGTSLEDLIDGLFGDPAANFHDVVQANQAGFRLLPAQLDLLRAVMSGQLVSALNDLAVGDVDSAINHLVVAVLAPLADGFAGPLVNAIGTTGEVVQNLIGALGSNDPAAVLAAVTAGPALVADRVLNGGYVTGAWLNSPPWPGILTSANGSIPRPDSTAAIIDVDVTVAAEAIDGRPPANEPAGIQHPDDVTNQTVMADHGTPDLSDGSKHRPRLLGNHAAVQGSRGNALAPIRDGIRDGIQGFREGVRGAVKSLTRRGDDNGAGGDGAGESP